MLGESKPGVNGKSIKTLVECPAKQEVLRLMKTLRANGLNLAEIAAELTARGIERREAGAGAQLYQSTPEESGITQALDRLADLLTEHPPNRLALFWSEAMRKQPVFGLTTISGQLKHAIVASGLTHYAIGKAAGVSSGLILRFMADERDPRLETVDKIAVALGLHLCGNIDDARRNDRPDADAVRAADAGEPG
jgi:DNA-binding phage protein